ncbi:UNVERIFIED_CONTAM: hypothetical protein K2H54_052960 [Gekko kuhli]
METPKTIQSLKAAVPQNVADLPSLSATQASEASCLTHQKQLHTLCILGQETFQPCSASFCSKNQTHWPLSHLDAHESQISYPFFPPSRAIVLKQNHIHTALNKFD